VAARSADLLAPAVGTGPSSCRNGSPRATFKARKNPRLLGQGQTYVDAVEIKIIPDEGNIIAQLPHGNSTMPARGQTKNYLS